MVQGGRGGGTLFSAFDISIDVKQGYPANSYVFCLLFDRVQDFIVAHVLPSSWAHTPYLAFLVTFILLYTDDVALIAASLGRL